VKCADVGRETGPCGALFPCRQGPRKFSSPKISGEFASVCAYFT
jgi:hypothetical protein